MKKILHLEITIKKMQIRYSEYLVYSLNITIFKYLVFRLIYDDMYTVYKY